LEQRVQKAEAVKATAGRRTNTTSMCAVVKNSG